MEPVSGYAGRVMTRTQTFLANSSLYILSRHKEDDSILYLLHFNKNFCVKPKIYRSLDLIKIKYNYCKEMRKKCQTDSYLAQSQEMNEHHPDFAFLLTSF